MREYQATKLARAAGPKSHLRGRKDTAAEPEFAQRVLNEHQEDDGEHKPRIAAPSIGLRLHQQVDYVQPSCFECQNQYKPQEAAL